MKVRELNFTQEEIKEHVTNICNVKGGWSEAAQKVLEERELRVNPEERYVHDCIQLFYSAKEQLNLPKNASKGNFEDLNLEDIFRFLIDEIDEIRDEIYEVSEWRLGEDPIERIKNKINYQRAREEIGDAAACLVGLLAKLNKMEKEEK